MRLEFQGQHGERTDSTRVPVAFRTGIVLSVAWALFLSGIIERPYSPCVLNDLLPTSEGRPECPENESDEENSGETESILGAKSSTRRSCRAEGTSRILSKTSMGSWKPALVSLSQVVAPARELENRNGVGAPLRC